MDRDREIHKFLFFLFCLVCNASPPSTACIIPLCRVSPFNEFMSLAFLGARDMKRGHSLLKKSEGMN